jgi:methionyl-tRNA formyltransferase
MRIVFMGSPDFAVPVLAALLHAGHEIACVYAQPPRPAGRGQKERPCPVHAFAAEKGLAVRTPAKLRSEAEQKAFSDLAADVAVVAAYGLILPAPILQAPRRGCINVHASLLPRWRGAAPIQRAIMAGDEETGVTIMGVDEGLDTGPMLLRGTVPITPATTASHLHDALADLGARLTVDALARLDTLEAQAQPAEGITYAHKLERAEGRLDWTRPAAELERLIRALNPWPGVWFEYGEDRIKALAADVAEGNPAGPPGTVLDDRLTIACGSGALRLTRVQRAGKAPADSESFLRGYSLPAGSRLQK